MTRYRIMEIDVQNPRAVARVIVGIAIRGHGPPHGVEARFLPDRASIPSGDDEQGRTPNDNGYTMFEIHLRLPSPFRVVHA